MLLISDTIRRYKVNDNPCMYRILPAIILALFALIVALFTAKSMFDIYVSLSTIIFGNKTPCCSKFF
jgi:hypothetical protein